MNPKLFVWTSDWHVVSDAAEHGVINETHPADALALAQHVATLDPAGVIDLGDCKDHYGAGSADELDQYIANVRDVIPWAEVNAGANAAQPILPGNHDELRDYGDTGPNDFGMFDSRFWGAPYHWAVDWAAPQVRFIGIHARAVHATADPLPYPGFFAVDAAERQWLADQLDQLPSGWQAVVCSHPPLNPVFGANIGHWSWLAHGGTELQQILRDRSSRVAAYLCGHRHGNMQTSVLDGIPHFLGPGVSYTQGNGYGGWVPIDYDDGARTLTFRFHQGPPSGYAPIAGYTPVVIQLPSLPGEPPSTPCVYTFEADTVLAGVGPLAGSPVTLTGSVEAA